MTFKERILKTKEFYEMKPPRCPKELYRHTGLPGEPSQAFIDALKDLESDEAKNKETYE
jgi:hypothetical protein